MRLGGNRVIRNFERENGWKRMYVLGKTYGRVG